MRVLIFYQFFIFFIWSQCYKVEQHECNTFTVQYFDRYGLKLIDNVNKFDDIWVRFFNGSHAYWLEIKRVQFNKFPVKIKAYNQTDTLLRYKPTNCQFIAITDLLPVIMSTGFNSENSVKGEFRLVRKTDVIRRVPFSLCNGTSGLVLVQNGAYYARIESDSRNKVKIVLIPSVSDDKSSQFLSSNVMPNLYDFNIQKRRMRLKRSVNMPVRPMAGPYIVELYLIVDSKLARMYIRNNYAALLDRIIFVVNHMNLVYSQLNIYFVIVQLEIWVNDQIKLSDENHMLMELQLYKRRYITQRHDCLHAILGENIGSARRGQAEPASMCGYNTCVGYTKDNMQLDKWELTHSIMHEVGHNFGLTHDNDKCQCYGCIMATGVEFGNCKFQWSDCSKTEIVSLLKLGMADCLTDYPDFDNDEIKADVMSVGHSSNSLPAKSMAFCGNGIVDENEECDCGGRNFSTTEFSHCCDPDTCRFRRFASCASGTCCDLKSCKIKSSGTVCRSQAGDCDLPEFCDGQSEWCPRDFHKIDGIQCTNDDTRESSHCYRGRCEGRQSQCKRLWGTTALDANEVCYRMNIEGTLVKNCGLEIPYQGDRYREPKNWPILLCKEEDNICGRLWCQHENERVLRAATPLWSVDETVENYQCSAVRFDLDYFLNDIGLVPNGADCKSGKMCWNGTCVDTGSLHTANCLCNGHGVCNNRHNCHCDPGFSPPNCTTFGHGGSIDSGPPNKFNYSIRFVISWIFIVIVILLTALTLAILIYHYNKRRWPFNLEKIKCPFSNNNRFVGRQVNSKATDDTQYSKFKRPNLGKLQLSDIYVKHEYQENAHSPLRSPTSPNKDNVYANFPLIVTTNTSPMKRNPHKPSNIKDKALLFENTEGEKVILTPKSKPINLNVKTEECPKRNEDLGKSDDFATAIKNVKLKSTSEKPKVLTKPIQKTVVATSVECVEKPQLISKPVKRDVTTTRRQSSQDRSQPINRGKSSTPGPLKSDISKARSDISEKPSIVSKHVANYSKKEETTLKPSNEPKLPKVAISKPSSNRLPLSEHPPKPIIDSKPHKINASKPLKNEVERNNSSNPHKEPFSKPSSNSKPSSFIASKSLKPDISGSSSSISQTDAPQKSVKDGISKTLKSDVSRTNSSTSETEKSSKLPSSEIKLSKNIISQPKLLNTTCTDDTCDLPATDFTLSRNVAPHKILKIDPEKAVKYLH